MTTPHFSESYTHYVYIAGPNGVREPVNLLNFTDVLPEHRRFMIHCQMDQGFCVAACPYGIEIQSLADLRNALEWVDDGRR